MGGKLEGKAALVTGASSGIGKATAIVFAKEGAKISNRAVIRHRASHELIKSGISVTDGARYRESNGTGPVVLKVVLADRRGEMLETVAAEIRDAGGEAVVVVSDASKEEDCKRMVDKAMESFGALHIAFNNHGVPWFGHYATTSAEDVTQTLDINLKSLVFCFKYQIPAMAKSGGKGSIITNSSATGSRVSDFLAELGHDGVYAASKAGVDMLMKYAAIEGAASGVRVNAVAPGFTDTPMVAAVPAELKKDLLARQLIERAIQPEEIAKLVVFLASDDAAMVTGSVYTMDGGFCVKG